MTKKSANEFVNVSDVRGNVLYTRDGYVFSYIKVEPVSVELFSERELWNFIETLSGEFSTERKQITLLSLDRPSDMDMILDDLREAYENAIENPIRRRIIHEEIAMLTRSALEGNSTEKEFYYCIFEPAAHSNELWKRANDMVSRLSTAGVESRVCGQDEIIELINACVNPQTGFSENADSVELIMKINAGR